uniref:Ribosomal protein uS12 methylthiotransferase RimO n=1 Tax=Chlorobium chlorochromatii (strain CaD3) TaxID=340177 RepID=RIMO_CHLCH|nr:RecName: Full=Ribosomal protein uS12 methylthiotransferase RimO; Short=uS12 MTTase; Short=uS12 methylthiotransferase; AltName: Full=Ribosomal protein uS12 (aspartate-C(3))-methylthiotransferase; AltName: Full=Ribosome maturation factor RimO [Chlorobium chlorochromatii CaD3]
MPTHSLFLLSLGCSKNTVDSERLLAQAAAAAIRSVERVDEADTILINTCAFIEDAKKESIEEMLAALDKKREGVVKQVFVMGCLPELYRRELQEELPEVDAFFGTRELPQILASLGARYRSELFDERLLLTPSHYAYLKISEGCNRICSFCSIPKIRGRYQSQPLEQLLREATRLQQQGVQELNLIAQDISLFGYDTTGHSQLNELLLRLSDMDFLWIRLLYAYPVNFPLEVIDTMRDRSNICNYLDIPLQHCNDRILRAMKRGVTKADTIRLLHEMRQRNPNIRLRTTMLVGFPGETRAEFEELLDFVEEQRFDRLGCFPYNHEEHAPSAMLEDLLSIEEKEERVSELMELQEAVAESLNREFEGKEIEVVVDSFVEEMAFCRSEYDAPEVDNECLLTFGAQNIQAGNFYRALINDSSAHELYGEIVQERSAGNSPQ